MRLRGWREMCVVGEEDLVLALETEEPFLERLRAELIPVSLLALSELRLRVLEKAGSELTRCIGAVKGPSSAMAHLPYYTNSCTSAQSNVNWVRGRRSKLFGCVGVKMEGAGLDHK